MTQEAIKIKAGVDLAMAKRKGEILNPCSNPLKTGEPCVFLKSNGCAQEDGLLQTKKGIECPLQRGIVSIIPK